MNNEEKYTYGQILDFYETITGFKNRKIPLKFAYALSKNEKIVDPVISEMYKIYENINPRFLEFEKKRMAVLTEVAKKDENGNPVFIENTTNVVIEDMDKYNNEISKLTEEYIDVIDEYNNLKNVYEEKYNSTINFPLKLYRLPLSQFPEELTYSEFKKLEIMLLPSEEE